MNANLRKQVFLAGLLVGLFASDTIHAGEASNRRALRLALYPFVPQKAEMLLSLKEKFESTHIEINFQFVDLPGYLRRPAVEHPHQSASERGCR